MNLFVAARGARAATLVAPIESALCSSAAAFPALADRAAETHRSEEGSMILATVAPLQTVIAPRVYTSSKAGMVVAFDGLPLWPSGAAAIDAGALADRWENLAEELEGAFAIIRLALDGERMEVLTDPLGNLPVFWTTLADGTQVIGNSLAAVAQVGDATMLDATGVATFLTLGWYGEGRTPLAGVSVLPGGSRVRFERDGRVVVDRHFGPRQLLEDAVPPSLDELASGLTGMVRSAGASDGIDLGLTAGLDSRVCLGIALTSGVDFRAYTEGRVGMEDVDAAREVSHRFGVQHTIVRPPTMDGFDARTLIRSYVAQGDCTSSFGQLVDHFPQLHAPARHTVKLVGLGGEVARANTHPVRAFLAAGPPLANIEAAQRRLTLRKTALFGGLVKTECGHATTGYVDRWFAARREEGFSARWLAESLYVFDAMARVHNGSVRRTAATADLAAPLSSRPFLRFAWSRSAPDRYADGTHRALLELLDRRLLDPPLEPVPAARPPSFTSVRATYQLMALALQARGPRGNAQALESPLWAAQRELHRELVGSLDDSPLFSFVERAELLRTLEPDVPPSSGAMRALSLLWWLHGR